MIFNETAMPDQDDILSDAEREALAAVTAPTAAPQKVLIVDDNAQAREALGSYLKSKGIPCLAAQNAERALAYLKGERDIGLLITDLRMEPFDGLELIRQIRESEKAALPIIIVSGDADVPDAIAAMHLSVVDFLLKPIDLDRLMELVRRELGIK
ncbi:response regulator [Pseudomonas sp. GD03860]|nr:MULTISPECIES: response regulator [Pseudomonas]MDD2059283.1 response regulator [Pseudomonas putida]MDH0636770.1 response regulator [Pseudomonas sp. GD03860]